MVTLVDQNHSAKIDLGELVSYQVDNHEYIHQKGSPGWRSSDTEMFPIIGPTNEIDFTVDVPRGFAIQDQHGLLRELVYEVIDETETKVVFQKKYNAGSLVKNTKFPEKSNKEWLVWPYSFTFSKAFELLNGELQITFTVSGERDMPFMIGYHPAFKLHTATPEIRVNERKIPLKSILEVGSRALEVPHCTTLTLKDEKSITLTTEGFGHFMLWTEVKNMVCLEPISFYPYAVEQRNLHEGFIYLKDTPKTFKVTLTP